MSNEFSANLCWRNVVIRLWIRTELDISFTKCGLCFLVLINDVFINVCEYVLKFLSIEIHGGISGYRTPHTCHLCVDKLESAQWA